MSAAERRAALRREGKDDAAMLENADPAGTLLAIAIGAVVVFAAAWAMKKDSAPSTTPTTCPPYAESGIPEFAKAKGYVLFHTNDPVYKVPPPTIEFTGNPMARLHSQADCSFYLWSGSYWTPDAKTNAELAAFRASRTVSRGPAPQKSLDVTMREAAAAWHPIQAFLPLRRRST
jgi:hypothetical protein